MKIKFDSNNFKTKRIDKNIFQLVESFEICLDGVAYYIFKGFSFNYLYKVDAETTIPSAIHDYTYLAHFLTTRFGKNIRYLTRKEADQLFYELLRYCGCNKLKAYIMYLAVRLFEKKHWKTRRLRKTLKPLEKDVPWVDVDYSRRKGL